MLPGTVWDSPAGKWWSHGASKGSKSEWTWHFMVWRGGIQPKAFPGLDDSVVLCCPPHYSPLFISLFGEDLDCLVKSCKCEHFALFQRQTQGFCLVCGVWLSSILCWAAAAQNKMIRRDLKWDGIDLPKLCITKGLRVGSPLQVFLQGGES